MSSRFEQDPSKPLVSLDVLPTILDALGVDSAIIENYPGHSILRSRGPESVRDMYHAQLPGNQYPHVLRYGTRQYLKARRAPDGDTCTDDILRDENEDFEYRLKSVSWSNVEGMRRRGEGTTADILRQGWEPRYYTDQGGVQGWGNALDAGLWLKDSEDEVEVRAFTVEAKALLDQHLAINQDYWALANKEKYEQLNRQLLQRMRGQPDEENTSSTSST